MGFVSSRQFQEGKNQQEARIQNRTEPNPTAAAQRRRKVTEETWRCNPSRSGREDETASSRHRHGTTHRKRKKKITGDIHRQRVREGRSDRYPWWTWQGGEEAAKPAAGEAVLYSH